MIELYELMLKIINVKKWQNAIKPLNVSRRVLFEAFIVCSCSVAFVNFWVSRLSVIGVSVFYLLILALFANFKAKGRRNG
jgi:hypothetical protein